MFIERSSARLRTVRTLFVLLGLLPCAGLCGWAAIRHSAAHRRTVESRCEQVIGLPVRIGRVEHVRPDAVRLHDCGLATADGGVLVAAAAVDVESSSTEVRVSVGRVECTPRLARAVTALVQQWLSQPARFERDCVVEVGELCWQGSTSSDRQAADRRTGLRIECVAAADGGRAVRISGGAGDGARTDELRVLATVADAAGDLVGPAALRLEVTGAVSVPLPVAILEACLGCEPGGLALGADAVVSGRIASVREAGGWSGTADGLVERIDLAVASAALTHRMSGDATVAIERIEWSRSRIAGCDCRLVATRGMVDQGFLDALVSTLGCRPGPEYRTATADRPRAFDEVACRLRLGPAGLDIRADRAAGPAIAVVRGGTILEEPAAAVPLERAAWLFSPPSALVVPASQASRWLMGAFSDDVLSAGEGFRGRDSSRTPAEQAGRPARRNDF